MYLKRLEIKGFKSFADHTELNLDSGINIIVGPNGCGKSNVVDAIRWVLGEANVRHLRGHKNEDVIFNGTDKHRALGMAQVEMTVDNADGSFPLDYSEISVSRKIFRSGESEFWLNKARVRLKDIVRLYMDTGLGKKGYSIISQGELERVLNGQPFDRRLMLEEAAGTIKYRQQRDEVQQRILTTGQDLVRVEDILREMGSRKQELHAKAERARTYLALRAEYDDLDRQVLSCQLQEAGANLQYKMEELASLQTGLSTLGNELKALQNLLLHTEDLLEGQRNQLNRTKEHKYKIESELNRMEAEVKLSQERIKNCQERIEAGGQDREKYAASLEKMALDLQVKTDDFQQQQANYRHREAELEELNQEIHQLEQMIAEQGSLFQRQSRLIFEKAKREAEVKNKITVGEDKNRRAQEKKERLLIRVEENQEQISTGQNRADELQEQIYQQMQLKEAGDKELAAAEVQKHSYLSTLGELEEEYRQITQEILRLEHRLAFLGDLNRNYSGYSEGVKSVFKAYNGGEPGLRGIKGLVADLIEVPPGMELAVGIALGKGLENIVVETAASARRAIQYLQQQRLGRVTFLPLDVLRFQEIPGGLRAQIKAEQGVLGLATDLLAYNSEYAKVVEYLLGRVLLVQDLECGLGIFKKYNYPLRIVSPAGELINANGAMSGGLINAVKSNPLQRKSEEKAIHEQLAKYQQSELLNRQSAASLANQIKNTDIELTRMKNQQAEIEFQLQINRVEKLQIQARIESATLDKDIYLRDISTLRADIHRTQTEMQDLQVNHRDMWVQNSQINDEIETLKTALEVNRREHAVKKERFTSYQEQLYMKNKELENTARNIAQFDQIRQSYLQSQHDAQTLVERLQSEVDIHLARIGLSTEEIAVKRQYLHDLAGSINIQQLEEQNLSKEIDKMHLEAAPLQQVILDQQEHIRALEMKIVRLETECEGLQAQWREKYAAQKPVAVEYSYSSRRMREFRLRLENLKIELELMGSIDIDSIKEYDEIETRYDFLLGQTSDLLAAKVSLEKLLLETEKIMAQNFAQFMSLADASFRRTFVEIFNGGEASLHMESAGGLTAGVDIVVKMPGKRSQALNLLSGGERALTCIAFIFSLLRLKPAPFCLLDEIDAALDETNLLRFADFLRGMARETQFIVITHRQATIETGNNIYGITMPQEGISAVLSLHCDKMDSLAG